MLMLRCFGSVPKECARTSDPVSNFFGGVRQSFDLFLSKVLLALVPLTLFARLRGSCWAKGYINGAVHRADRIVS